jgi:hypothetical protein
MNIMKKKYTLLCFIIINAYVQAQNIDAFFEKSDVFFKKYVDKTKVDYQSIKNSPELLNEILDNASKIDLSKSEKLVVKAFWINAYNLTVIKAIVAKYPVKSALDVEGFFNKQTFTIAKQNITLDDVENKMLRAVYKDPYIHFALVCGANGCPPLISEAYLPDTIFQQMYDQVGLALNNPGFIKLNKSAKSVEISQIFEWYKEDFLLDNKSVIDFINIFREEKIDPSFKVGNYKYDWTLNSK